MGRLILVTGGRGAGKTRFCTFVARRMQRRGCDVAGLLSPARFEGIQKIGIDVLELRSNRTRPLARRIESGPQSKDDLQPVTHTDHWSFDDSTLAWGNDCLRFAAPCDVLIVDELGPLEFIRSQGWLGGLAALDAGMYRLALVVVRPELLELAQGRWPGCGVFFIAAGNHSTGL